MVSNWRPAKTLDPPPPPFPETLRTGLFFLGISTSFGFFCSAGGGGFLTLTPTKSWLQLVKSGCAKAARAIAESCSMIAVFLAFTVCTYPLSERGHAIDTMSMACIQCSASQLASRTVLHKECQISVKQRFFCLA